MSSQPRPLSIGLVAHDAMKQTLLDWVSRNKETLLGYCFFATGTTTKALRMAHGDLHITALQSGPLGGDQQLGAMICEGKLDLLVFFQDPMTAQPHDVDVKALVRLTTLYDVPLACNPATADLLISSPHFADLAHRSFDGRIANWTSYLNRELTET